MRRGRGRRCGGGGGTSTRPWVSSKCEGRPSPSSVLVRDSKDKAGPRLSFSPSAWADFVAFAAEAQAPEGE
ncbi:DUF397 domain-containing protein [Kitasatospora purpeofusca]|uniref:DUF397 domain-containing protein n=1 Tax=Kitasatospora purpeofusca TaxID=67352 RepID=UPI003F4D50D3